MSVGHASSIGETFPFRALFGDQGRHNRALATFHLLQDATRLGDDLSWLAGLLAAGTLDPQDRLARRLVPGRRGDAGAGGASGAGQGGP